MKQGLFVACAVAVFALGLSACNMQTPSQVDTGAIRLQENMKTTVLDAGRIDKSAVNIIADDYKRNGKGKISAVVTYLAGNPLNEVEARKQAGQYVAAFAGRGLHDMQVDYVPVKNKTEQKQLILSYLAITALPPARCGRITGYQGSDVIETAADYGFGCETKSIVSKMISRPEDLAGRAGAPDEDSRRQGAVVEKYKSGTPNEKLEGETASQIGQSGG